MSNEIFMAAVKKITEKSLPLGELIGVTEQLKATGDIALISQLYTLWVGCYADDPMRFVAYFNHAVVLSDMGDLAAAKTALETAIAINPDFYPPYINLGTVLERMGKAGDAVNQWTAMANRLPAVTGANINFKTTAMKQIGRVLETNQYSGQAEAMLRQSLEIHPRQPDVIQHYVALRLVQCEWPVVQGWDGMDKKTLMKNIGPLSMAIYTDDPMLQLASGWNYNRNSIGYPAVDLQAERDPKKEAARTGRRRIGYVSSDLRNHAVGFIMAEMLGLHNRDEFEIFAYYCGIAQTDDLQQRIKGTVDHWVDINNMSDEAAARRIMADGIDILVDVNGYTKDARTKLFAMRPAPVIVNWLGYPGSMGSPYHHYIVADDYIIPHGHEIYFSEKVLRLPCYQPNDRKRVISPNTPTRSDVGLPDNAVVFCSFNGVQKISRFTFERWLEILKRVPGSVLWLLENIESTSNRLREYAKKNGIDPARLIFAGKRPNPDHLARYKLADLFLDNLPYGAHVTASDALWMGVPILTLSGRSFAARVCGSLVSAAGLPELICTSPQEYVERAAYLGNNPAEITKLKKKLAANRDSCMLFDMETRVKDLEALYHQMWEEFTTGQLPRPNLANMETYLDIGTGFDHDATETMTVEDYEGLYRRELAKRHNYCQLSADTRLWTQEDIAAAETGQATPPKKSSVVLNISESLKKKKKR